MCMSFNVSSKCCHFASCFLCNILTTSRFFLTYDGITHQIWGPTSVIFFHFHPLQRLCFWYEVDVAVAVHWQAVEGQSLVAENLVRVSSLCGGGLLQCFESSRAPSPSKPPLAPKDRFYLYKKWPPIPVPKGSIKNYLGKYRLSEGTQEVENINRSKNV